MPIITISRDSYSTGKKIAEIVASRLGYECISREVLLEASKEFNVPEIRLSRAIHDAPTILDRIGYRKEKYIAYIQTAILRHFRKDNVVYCGLAGHFFVDDISHVLKVRIIADFQDRVKNEAERDQIDPSQAAERLKKDDEERMKWSRHLYGIDTSDPRLYDLIIHIKKITPDDAAAIICHAVSLDQFKTSPASQQAMDDLALAAEVKAALVDLIPSADVETKNGIVTVRTAGMSTEQEKLFNIVKSVVAPIDGIRDIRFDFKPKDPVH